MALLQQVHVRVNDAATGKPTPVRVRFAGPDGTYYPPHGRLAEFATDLGVDVGGNVLLDNKAYAFIDGACEIHLPAGVPLTVEISKGPEYRPLRAEVTVTPGKLALRFEVERWIDLRAAGWYSGDAQAYALGPRGALLEASAEDIAVVNVLAREGLAHGYTRNWRAIPNILDFSGQSPAAEVPGHLVAVNTLNQHAILGRLLLLNCHRVVYPLTFGGPDRFDDWTLADWCDQCHRKGGLVIGDSFFGSGNEVLADLILGKIDALHINDEFDNPDADAQLKQESPLRDWYGLLDCGYRVPLVGGTGKDCNLLALGTPRTYAYLGPGEPLTYKAWVEAVRGGRTFVSSGPLLMLSVNGHGPGAVLEASPSEPLRVRAEANSLSPLQGVDILANNEVVARGVGSLEAEVSLPEGGWLVARCWGEWDVVADMWHAAITSPVYVRAGEQERPAPAEEVARLRAYLDRMLEWVEHKARCQTPQQRQRLAGVFQSAREALLQRAQPS